MVISKTPATACLKNLNRNTVVPLKLNWKNPLFYLYAICELIILPIWLLFQGKIEYFWRFLLTGCELEEARFGFVHKNTFDNQYVFFKKQGNEISFMFDK